MLIALLLGGCAGRAAPPPTIDPDAPASAARIAPGPRFFVELAPGQSEAELRALVLEALGEVRDVEPLFGEIADPALARIYLVELVALPDGLSSWDAAYRLEGNLAFVHVEPDLRDTLQAETRLRSATRECVFGGAAAPTDVAWSLRKLRAPEAWALTPPPGGRRFGEGISVCHPDTGWTSHHDLGARKLDLTRAWNVIDGTSNARDALVSGALMNPGHGTATGSVIASEGGVDAAGTTGPGRITGVAPGATLVPLRTVESVVQVFDSDVAKAVVRAADSGCEVISMSLGGRAFFGLERAVDYATRRGLIVVAAAGNCVGFVVAPAVYEEVVAVAATNEHDRPWKGSSKGRAVVISAPGENVWCADFRTPGSSPESIGASNGTSFATAEIAGAAALWLAFHGRDRIEEAAGEGSVQGLFVDALSRAVTTPAGWDAARYGAGILDAERLLASPLVAASPREAAPRVDGARAQSSELRLLARTLDRDPADLRRALGVVLGLGDEALDVELERLGPELLELALRAPEAVAAALEATVAPDGRPRAGPAARARAARALDDVASDTLRSRLR